MKTYDLYLESGPKRMTTVVHVPALVGCTWNAPTTDEAVERAPAEVRTFLRFLEAAGERVQPHAAITTRVAHHEITGGFLSIAFLDTDAEPLSLREGEALMRRLAAMHSTLRRTLTPLSPRQLDAKPARGRPIRQILAHVCVEGAYLRGVSGSSRIQREVDQGRREALDALDELHALELERLRAMPDDERSSVVQRPASRWSARHAVRRMLEHCWEHLREIEARLDNNAGSATPRRSTMPHRRSQGGTSMGDKSPKNTQKSNKQKAQKKAGAKAGKK